MGRADVSTVVRAITSWVIAGTVMLTASVAAAASTTEAAPSEAVSRPVAFVPLGSFPRSDAAKLARYFEQRLGLRTSVESRIALPKSALNRSRKQFVAEELIDVVASRRAAAGSQPVLIGLTTEDMYTRYRPDYRFTFSIRHPSGLVVVSRARMDPQRLGLTPDPALRMRRLQKMVMKNTASSRSGSLRAGIRRAPLHLDPRY